MIAFDNTYARLPERFFALQSPTPVSKPGLIRLNHELAAQLGIDVEALSTPEGIGMLAGNGVPAGAEPLAMAYAGFQFGNWVPQLGDGRALLLGEVIDRDGVRHDLQLKGSGPTPFSRSGDGRAGLGPVLREYILSEAMAALHVPTTRALAAVTTGDIVMRETPAPGAVLTRVAQSHVRVGTFQYFAGRGDVEAVRTLADYIIARHYPALADVERPYLALLRETIERQAQLIAQWQSIGFIHGVMNTDNMSIIGETIDYGPCAFMDSFHPDTVYSSIDRTGRYAYRNQPAIGQWNLSGLAQALLPILDDDPDAALEQAKELLEGYHERFEAAHGALLRRKLGLGEGQDGDDALAEDLLKRMANNRADFTLTFRRLCDAMDATGGTDDDVGALFEEREEFDAWAVRWRARIANEGGVEAQRRQEMLELNPAYIPRNHLVEEVIRAAVDGGDLEPFQQLVDVLSKPFVEQPGRERYATPPRPEQVVHETFCGT